MFEALEEHCGEHLRRLRHLPLLRAARPQPGRQRGLEELLELHGQAPSFRESAGRVRPAIDETFGRMKGFREFILRGNLVDLAIAVVIGAAFGAVVTALVGDLITPLIAAIGGKPNFNNLTFTINSSHFRYGHFLNALLTFVIIAAVVYFFIVKPVAALLERYTPKQEVGPQRSCPECLSDIPVAARRCAFCTAEVTPAA